MWQQQISFNVLIIIVRKVVFQLKVSIYNKNMQTTSTYNWKQHFFVARKSDKCRLRSDLQTVNSSAILKTAT